MKDKFNRAKKFVRDHPVQTAVVVGSLIGAAGMRYALRNRIVPDRKTPFLWTPEGLLDYLANENGLVTFDTPVGDLYLTATAPAVA